LVVIHLKKGKARPCLKLKDYESPVAWRFGKPSTSSSLPLKCSVPEVVLYSLFCVFSDKMLSPSFILGASSVLLSLVSSAAAQQYINPDLYTPTNFFSKFNFITSDDPTHGYVE
jgi:hypothetical protein